MKCYCCPRMCGADRSREAGFCGAGEKIKVAKAYLHMWEEPFISGARGSGTVFFSHCNLNCVYCQNYEISALGHGREISADRLLGIMTELEENGAENINLVTPTHFVPMILPALEKYKAGGGLPIVYNCGGYESVETLKTLEGVVDVYLPDIKYFDAAVSARFSGAADYFDVCSAAVAEMKRQVPDYEFDGGVMTKGVALRHLVLPTLADQGVKILDWVAENLGKDVYVSLMRQYTPCFNAPLFPQINRPVTEREYQRVIRRAELLGMPNVFTQEEGAVGEEYVPPFDMEGV